MPLRAIALNCTLKDDPSEASSTDAMIAVLKKAFAEREVVVTETVRVATLDIKPGDGFDQLQGPAENPDKVTKTAKMVASNAAHLAGLLKGAPYPG